MFARALGTIGLLCVSNVFMTFAWYGNLKLQQIHPQMKDWPLYLVVLLSWGLALFEYSFMIPANRMGSQLNGGPFSLMQLKVIQEVVSLIVFCVIANFLFQGQSLHWNHLAALVCLVLAVYFVFMNND